MAARPGFSPDAGRSTSASRPGSGRGGAMVEPAWMAAKRKTGEMPPSGPPAGMPPPPSGGASPTDRLLGSMQPAPPPPAPPVAPPSTSLVGEPPMPPYVFLDAICSANKWEQAWNLFAGPPGPNNEEMYMWKVKITVPGGPVQEYLPKRLLSCKCVHFPLHQPGAAPPPRPRPLLPPPGAAPPPPPPPPPLVASSLLRLTVRSAGFIAHQVRGAARRRVARAEGAGHRVMMLE